MGGRRLLEAIAAAGPVVMLVDDIHWAEPTFLEFLDYLLETATSSPLLVLGSARHELSERHPDWAESHSPLLIRLEPLSDADAGRIVEELLGALDESVRARIAQVAEGNPLYVEQIVSMLVETGALQRGVDGWVARQGTDQLQIPPTVQALVAARLDALQGEERSVVDPASVIGLSFPLDAVTNLVDEPTRPKLDQNLNLLVGKQLVRQLPDEDVIYRFNHQIIRDTAYNSLLKRVRAMLHERFVDWAEPVNRERGRELEFEEIHGYHLEQAYRYRTELGVIDEEARRVAERAAAKLGSAGRRAHARTDMPAAVGLLRRATKLLVEGELDRVELLLELAEAEIQLGDLAVAAATVLQATKEAEAIGDARTIAKCRLMRLWVRTYSPTAIESEGDPEAIVADVIRTLEEQDDAAGLARAWRIRGILSDQAGRYGDAASAAERFIEYAERAGEPRLVARGTSAYASEAVWSTLPIQDLAERMEAHLRKVAGDRKAEAYVALGLAQLQAMLGDFGRARDLYRRGQALLRELGPSVSAMTTSIASARVEYLAGSLDAAEQELRRDEEELRQTGEQYFRSSIAGALARVLLRQEKLEEASEFADLARELADPDDADPQVLWRSVKAGLLARAGDGSAAADLMNEAVQLASTTDDAILQAEVLLDQSELLRLLGRDDAAEPPLRAALELFTQKGDVVSAERVRRKLGAPSAV